MHDDDVADTRETGRVRLFSSPETVFAFVAPLVGLLFMLLVPPFQVGDEYNHFYRACQVAEGGPHGELIRQPGSLYRKLFATQYGRNRLPDIPEEQQ